MVLRAGPLPSGVPHLDAEGAARAAREGNAGRLILTHIQPNTDVPAALDRARETFVGETILASPGLRLEV